MQLSGVTESDYLELIAGFEILSAKKWNCEACVRTTDAATRKAVKGCEGGKQFTLKQGDTAYTLDRCLGNYYRPAVSQWYRAFKLFEKGILPFAGPLMDQPAKVLDIFSVYESLEYEKQAIAQKNAEAKAKRGNRGR